MSGDKSVYTYKYTYIYIHAAAAAAAALCCCTAVMVAAAVLLLPDTVRHHVPDAQIWCWRNQSDPSVLFSFI